MYPPKKGYPKSCVRYLELTTHKTPSYLIDTNLIKLPPHSSNTKKIRQPSINSASSRQTSACYLTDTGGETESRDFVETRKRKAVEETDTGNISTQLWFANFPRLPPINSSAIHTGLEEVRIEGIREGGEEELVEEKVWIRAGIKFCSS